MVEFCNKPWKSYRTIIEIGHERNSWRQLWPILKHGDVILADRGFCGYADYWCLLQQRIDSMMRLHQRRKARDKSQFEGA